jgi:hypothetical protein
VIAEGRIPQVVQIQKQRFRLCIAGE